MSKQGMIFIAIIGTPLHHFYVGLSRQTIMAELVNQTRKRAVWTLARSDTTIAGRPIKRQMLGFF
jgi:hypothetical protein